MKLPSIKGCATTAALNAVDNEIPKISYMIKTTDYVVKIKDTEEK